MFKKIYNKTPFVYDVSTVISTVCLLYDDTIYDFKLLFFCCSLTRFQEKAPFIGSPVPLRKEPLGTLLLARWARSFTAIGRWGCGFSGVEWSPRSLSTPALRASHYVWLWPARRGARPPSLLKRRPSRSVEGACPSRSKPSTRRT